MNRSIATLLVAVAALALSPLPAAAQQPLVIKFSCTIAPDTPKGKAAPRFKELVEAKTQGKVKIDVHPNASLYKDKEEIETLQVGAVQMLAPAVSKFGPCSMARQACTRYSTAPLAPTF
jgi:C4-dicarboxylate-binding protein DctP